MAKTSSPQRALPSVDRVLRALPGAISEFGHERVSAAVRAELADLRSALADGQSVETSLDSICAGVSDRLAAMSTGSLVRVFNLSGTVLHTNLGRALLPETALQAVLQVAGSASNLEYDLDSGKRGDRDTHVESLLCELTGAEAATVVNNNAAAVLLTLNTLAAGREVPVSRGELVEIGGSFRMPEIIQSAGCTLVEVGTTNRTHLADYAAAINVNTAMFLKVHTSNYRIEGFTTAVQERELAELARSHALPFVVDAGSGNLCDLGVYGLPSEPTVRQVIDNGADMVTFSGDKLLGGPQSGIIVGRQDLISRIKSNPMKRALRLDKMTIAALHEVLRLYQVPSSLAQTLPTLKLLTRSVGEIRQQAEALAADLAAVLAPRFSVQPSACESQVGSGALPQQTIPSYGLAIMAADASDQSLRELADALRRLPLPVIGRINKGQYLLDLRTLTDEIKFRAQLLLLKNLLA